MFNQSKFKLDLQLFGEGDSQDDLEKVDPEKNYGEALKKLKENSVPKEAYKKLEEQNKQLLDSILNGGHEPEDKSKRDSIEKLRAELFGKDRKPMTNLEYWKKTLDLRDQLLEQGKTDPFVPVGKKVQATLADYQSAEHVAELMRDCIKASGGDPDAFNNELHTRGLD